MLNFKEREYRVVSCTVCRFRDWYDIVCQPSYPPRCPHCGASCTHDFVYQDKYIAFENRKTFGKDQGVEPLKRLVRNERQGRDLWKGSW